MPEAGQGSKELLLDVGSGRAQAVGKLVKVHNAQIGNTVLVFPLKLAAATAAGVPLRN
jgi:hypothetical protein